MEAMVLLTLLLALGVLAQRYGHDSRERPRAAMKPSSDMVMPSSTFAISAPLPLLPAGR